MCVCVCYAAATFVIPSTSGPTTPLSPSSPASATLPPPAPVFGQDEGEDCTLDMGIVTDALMFCKQGLVSVRGLRMQRLLWMQDHPCALRIAMYSILCLTRTGTTFTTR